MMGLPYVIIVHRVGYDERILQGNIHAMNTFVTFALVIQFNSVHMSTKISVTQLQRFQLIQIQAFVIGVFLLCFLVENFVRCRKERELKKKFLKLNCVHFSSAM